MPLYEYKCEECGHRFESVRHMSESDARLRCPKCGRETARKQISTFFSPAAGESCAPRGGG